MAGFYRSKGSSIASKIAGAARAVIGGIQGKERVKQHEKEVADRHKKKQEIVAARGAEARKTAEHRSALTVAAAKEKMAYKSKLAAERSKAGAEHKAKLSTERAKKVEQIKTSGMQRRLDLQKNAKKVQSGKPKNDMQVGRKQIVKMLRKKLGANKKWS